MKPPFMTRQRALAAALLAEGGRSNEEVAELCRTTRNTLYKWSQVPEFQQMVERLRSELIQATRDAHLTTGIADRVERVKRLDKHWRKLEELVDIQLDVAMQIAKQGVVSADPEEREIARGIIATLTKIDGEKNPEKKSGLLARAAALAYLPVDYGLLKELRSSEKQAAIELGQWEESPAEGNIKTFINVDLELI